MNEAIKQYVEILIEMTYGFRPIVEVNTNDVLTYITLDGAPEERQQLMGRDATNFKAIKILVRIFCKRNGVNPYLYIKNAADRTDTKKY